MTTKISSNTDLNGVFSSADIEVLKELSGEIRQEEADDVLDLTSLFSRVEIPNLYGITLKDHLIMVSGMFPVSRFPDIWRDIIMGPAEEGSVEEDLCNAETAAIDAQSKYSYFQIFRSYLPDFYSMIPRLRG
jgi:hypothetical protein